MEQDWPSGTITFLFTDIEKSTLLWERHGDKMRPVLASHDALLRTAVEDHGGRVVKTTGDGLHAAFATAVSALEAALAAQRRLHSTNWSEIAPDMLRVRMGLHTGEAQWRDGDYYGTAVNRAARIMSLGHGGQVLLSAITASLLQGQMSGQTGLRSLGVVTIRGLEQEERIFQLLAPELESEFPPLSAGRAPTGNLPAHAGSFIGRIREMAEIRAALPHTRLLTITGPGGTGKSRLSLQVAADVQADYEHGAWFVELAPLTEPDLVLRTVAGVLNLDGQTREQIQEVLFDYLREKELLLILDNCEHLIEACARLAADLIAACPRLTIMASSREGLGIYGERSYHLPTLSLPAADGLTAATAVQSEAVQLFVERANAAQQGFILNDANAPVVAQVVRRLDGIPLAIELAAARMNVFTVEQMAGRLDQRFRLLTGGSRTAMPRQQTLRALIDWSYDLLDEEEQELFRRLAVFMGGWTFEAAEFIADPLDVYILLPQLVGKSLVIHEADPTPEFQGNDPQSVRPRYRYLETIRQYARDRLVEKGEVEEARDRHFAYYEALGKTVQFGTGPGVGMLGNGQIIVEQDNLRAIVEWGTDRFPARTLDLLWELIPFLSEQLPGSESIAWTSSALQRLDSLPPVTGEAAKRREESRFRGLVGSSLLKMFMGLVDDAFYLASELIPPLSQSEVDPILLAMALFVKTQTAFFLEDPGSNESLAQAEALLRNMDSHPAREWMLAMVLMLAAEIESHKGNRALVERYFQESSSIFENSYNKFLPWLEYSRLLIMMELAMDLEQINMHYEKSIRILRQNGDSRMAAMAESDWAHRLRHKGDLDEALAIYQRMVVEWRYLGHRPAVANILENIAFIDRVQGRPDRAVTLLGAASRIREAAGQDMLRSEREEYEQVLAALKSDLPPAEFDGLWAAGRAMSTDAIIALAAEDGHETKQAH